ncbi:MAG: tRNA (N6-threonylcarbamoyladenosine(37)-N6)-methyltransferase TrmO [Gammaproteobacteria bacterium]|nr:tRNA (N6-threonylcarbamoyladenosine(37)-N6)-methyltransferase TrmO [Gammaproteobacteria bacterium]
METFHFNTIAIVHSCYKEKFGTPRQSGLSDNAEAIIELLPPYNHEDYIRELEGFSHIWLQFVFHQHLGKAVKATVRPPRLGGNKRVGVFASRSPFRPNPIGLSVVKLNKIHRQGNKTELYVSAADLIDQTPIIDIKPYIAYADSIADSQCSYAENKPGKVLQVSLSEQAEGFIQAEKVRYPTLEQLLRETIALDPRPAYEETPGRVYGLCLYDLNIKWTVNDGQAMVSLIETSDN